jgi:predicted  nucleic acid-binding Zn-ribbon protein
MSVLYELADEFEVYGSTLRNQANSSAHLTETERGELHQQAKEMNRISQQLSDLGAQKNLLQIQNATSALTESVQTLRQEIQRLNLVNQKIAKVAGWIDLGNRMIEAIQMPTPDAFEAILRQLKTNLQ